MLMTSEVYNRLRKKKTGIPKDAEVNRDEALRLKNCFTQGRELYLAGKNGSPMGKRLNFFYALTAYAYGISVATVHEALSVILSRHS
jgi:hypothetical protein